MSKKELAEIDALIEAIKNRRQCAHTDKSRPDLKVNRVKRLKANIAKLQEQLESLESEPSPEEVIADCTSRIAKLMAKRKLLLAGGQEKLDKKKEKAAKLLEEIQKLKAQGVDVDALLATD